VTTGRLLPTTVIGKCFELDHDLMVCSAHSLVVGFKEWFFTCAGSYCLIGSRILRYDIRHRCRLIRKSIRSQIRGDHLARAIWFFLGKFYECEGCYCGEVFAIQKVIRNYPLPARHLLIHLESSLVLAIRHLQKIESPKGMKTASASYTSKLRDYAWMLQTAYLKLNDDAHLTS
jgi:hypothetical protein